MSSLMSEQRVSSAHPSQFPLFPTVLVIALMSGLSLAGLLLPHYVYPTVTLQQTFQTNDLVNLIAGVPALLVPLWLARRGRLLGRLLLSGGLLYVLYNTVAYLFGRPFGWWTAVNLLLVLLSAYALLDVVRRGDSAAIAARLAASVPIRLPGLTLLLFGSAFLYRAVALLMGPLTGEATLPLTDVGVLIADLLLSTFWIGGGLLLLRRKPLGYATGGGLLYAGSALFVGLILFLLLNPLLTGAAFSLVDLLVVAAMSLVCFLPFGGYVRGVITADRPAANRTR